jgi:hypothetical protein
MAQTWKMLLQECTIQISSVFFIPPSSRKSNEYSTLSVHITRVVDHRFSCAIQLQEGLRGT